MLKLQKIFSYKITSMIRIPEQSDKMFTTYTSCFPFNFVLNLLSNLEFLLFRLIGDMSYIKSMMGKRKYISYKYLRTVKKTKCNM